MNQRIEAAIERVTKTDYGETITHDDLAGILQLVPRSHKYYCDMRRVKKEALVSRKQIESNRGIGYRVVEPHNYTPNAIKQFRLGARRLSAGSKILKYAPVELMNEEDRREHMRVVDRTQALEAHMTGALVEIRMIRRNHPLRGAFEK